MMQQFFPQELNGRFYLKEPKSKRPSMLIFIVRIEDRIYKLNLQVKVYPSQWNQAIQKAYISPILSNADNENNRIANQKIEEVKGYFVAFKSYLCGIDTFDKEVVTLLFNQAMRKQKKQDQDNKIDNIVKVIHDTVYNNTTLKKGTIDNYLNKGLPALEFYLDHLQKDEHKKVDNFGYFTTEFFTDFGQYIYTNYTYDNGEPYAISTLNSILKYAKSAVLLVARSRQYLTEQEISALEVRYFKDKSAPNHIALRDDEVMLLYNYKPQSQKDEEVRDIFLLECTFGHRIADILRLDERADEIGGKYYITITPKKTPQKRVEVGIIFDIAKRILVDKYHCKLPSISKDAINKNIKRIAQEAGIKGEELQSYHYQGESQPREIKRPRYKCISTHTGRRTFISMLVARGWNYEQISKFTGQTVKTVEHYDKATNKYIDIYKDTVKNRPNEVVHLYDNLSDESNQPDFSEDLDSLLQELFREKDLFDLKKLFENKVDIFSLEKITEVKKHLENISRAEQYKSALQKFYQEDPMGLKQKLVSILRMTTLLDSDRNLLRITVTMLQKLGLNCIYADGTYKYPGKTARKAYLLVITNKDGIIIQ
jgi:integrase